jgi:hypothetical protein
MLLELLLVAQQSVAPIPFKGEAPLLPPITRDAYGPGKQSDSTGRIFEWRANGQKHTDPLLQVRPNAYGPGVGADQYGRAL